MNNQIKLSIVGMACAGCVSSVEKSLLAVDGAKEVVVSLDEGTANISGQVAANLLIEAVKEAGFSATELEIH